MVISWHFFLFLTMTKIVLNGEFLDSEEPVFHYNNRSFRYGDGFFETMRIRNGMILFEKLHEERIINSFKLLGFGDMTVSIFNEIKMKIVELCLNNLCNNSGRLRLSFYRNKSNNENESIHFHYLIEATGLEEDVYLYNETGLNICIYPDARISMDKFSNLKSANYLPYVMASIFAKEGLKDDALLLNNQERIVESSIANVFWIKDEVIYTPSLSEGCIDGVVRKFLLNKFKETGIRFYEKPLTRMELMEADEVFLTNAIKGIRWVSEFETKKNENLISKKLYHLFLKDLA